MEQGQKNNHSSSVERRGGEIVGKIQPVIDDRVPKGYEMYRINVRLKSGNTEPAIYGYRTGTQSDPDAYGRLSDALVTGFRWALEAPEFADHEQADDDRAQEIGNMMAAGIAWGLTEDEIIHLYKIAYEQAVKSGK